MLKAWTVRPPGSCHAVVFLDGDDELWVQTDISVWICSLVGFCGLSLLLCVEGWSNPHMSHSGRALVLWCGSCYPWFAQMFADTLSLLFSETGV